MSLMSRLRPWRLALALASTASPVLAGPFTVEDLLRNETFGAVRITPDQTHILFERQGPYGESDRFDLGYFNRWTTSRVWISGRDTSSAPRPLIVGDESRGVVLGDFSPSGRRLIVHRLQNDRWETGVVEMATGEVRWLGLGAEPPVKGETVVWRSDDELILAARVDGDLPYEIGALATAVRRTTERRDADARGEAGTSVWGAGAFADLRGYAAPLRTWRIDLRTGARTLLSEGQALDLALSDDGRWLAVLDRGPPYPVDPTAPLLASEQAEQRRLKIIDLDSGEAWAPCATCDVASGLLSWSSDGRLLIWIKSPSRRPTEGRLVAIRPVLQQTQTYDLDPVVPEVGQSRDMGFQAVRAAWLNDTPILLGRSTGAARDDWYRVGASPMNLTAALPTAPGGLEAIADPGFLTFADGALWSVSEGGAATRIEGPTSVSAVSTLTRWASLRRRLNTPPAQTWALGRSPNGSLWRLEPGRSPKEVSGPSEGDLLAVADTIAVDEVEDNGVETLRLRDAEAPRLLSVVNSAYGAIDFAEIKPVSTPGAPDGFRDSLLYVPPGGLRPGTPVIIVAYPGAPARPGNPAEFLSMANPQLLAGLGYAVLVPSLPGTGDDGPAAHLTERILATLDAALAQYPDLDGDRVGYLGHSFGGYTGLVLATETSRIRSIVILAGTSNLTATWGGFGGFSRANSEFGLLVSRRGAGWAEQGQGRLGGPPWALPETYVANSPFFRADRITAPILLVHGELDFVPVTEPESLFTALWRQNKDAQLVTYWGEQHLFYSQGVIRDLWGRIDVWFARTLGVSPARLTPPPVGLPTAGPTPPETPPPGSPALRPASGAHLRPAAPP